MSNWTSAMYSDKRLHFTAGAMATLAGFLLGLLLASALPARYEQTVPDAGAALGAFVGTVPGWVKEDYDRRHPLTHTRDGWDAYATAAGATTALMLYMLAQVVLVFAAAVR